MKSDIGVHAFGGMKRLRLVALTAVAVFAAPGPANGAVHAVNRLIPRQYQAKSGDTAVMAGAGVRAGLRAHGAGPHAVSTTRYLSRNTRYQLQRASFISSFRLPRPIVNPRSAISVPVPLHNYLQSGRQISGHNALTRDPRAISSSDARLLLRLGLGLGLTYIVFLAAWFWRTRNRAEGAAARVVRF